MASDVRFNDDERDALQGLPLIARWLYFEIRARMDFATGLTGARRGAGVSWRTFQEALYVEPHQGVEDSGTPSQMKMRRAAEWLRKAGLLVNQSKGTRLVFFLPLAASDFSVQKKPDRNPTGTRQGYPDREADRHEPDNGAGLTGEPNRQPDRKPTGGDPQKADTPPGSGIRKGDIDTEGEGYRGVQSARERFRLPLDWQPRSKQLGDHLRLLRVQGLSQEAVVAVLDDFRSFWSAEPAIRSQDQWEQRLAKDMKRAAENKAGGRYATGRQYGRAGRTDRPDLISEELDAIEREYGAPIVGPH